MGMHFWICKTAETFTVINMYMLIQYVTACAYIASNINFSNCDDGNINQSISRRLEAIIEHVTCNGSENSLGDCLLEVSQNPQTTDLSLVYLSCGKPSCVQVFNRLFTCTVP